MVTRRACSGPARRPDALPPGGRQSGPSVQARSRRSRRANRLETDQAGYRRVAGPADRPGSLRQGDRGMPGPEPLSIECCASISTTSVRRPDSPICDRPVRLTAASEDRPITSGRMKNTNRVLGLGFVRVSTLNFTMQRVRPLSDCLRLTDRPQRTLIEVIPVGPQAFC